MTIREQVEQQLKEVTNTPDRSQLKNELIEATKWVNNNRTSYKGLGYEDGVRCTLEWVLGLNPSNPIDEEYEES